MKQTAQFLISTSWNSQLHLLNFPRLKKFIAQHYLETKRKTFKAIDLKMKKKIRCLIYTI